MINLEFDATGQLVGVEMLDAQTKLAPEHPAAATASRLPRLLWGTSGGRCELGRSHFRRTGPRQVG
jgi:hypothetical protein